MFHNQMMKPGFLGRLSAHKNVNWTGILDGTQKTLNIVNQAIPIIYQVKPLIGNAKTLLNLTKLMNEQTPKEEIKVKEETKKELKTNPIFYI